MSLGRTFTTSQGETVDIHYSGVAYCLNCRLRFPYWEDIEELDHDCEERS